jgi:hypothetical protein
MLDLPDGICCSLLIDIQPPDLKVMPIIPVSAIPAQAGTHFGWEYGARG